MKIVVLGAGATGLAADARGNFAVTKGSDIELVGPAATGAALPVTEQSLVSVDGLKNYFL
jgi:hypothetical protein